MNIREAELMKRYSQRNGDEEAPLTNDQYDDEEDGTHDEDLKSADSAHASSQNSSTSQSYQQQSTGSFGSGVTMIGGGNNNNNHLAPSLEGDAEDQYVATLLRCSKIAVVVFLIICAAACAIATFIFFNGSQRDNFRKAFEDYSTEIVKVSKINSENVFATIASVATTISSYAEDTNKTWPFVTVPHFEQRGQQLLRLSGAQIYVLNVYVNESQVDEWLNYSIQNQGWVQDGIDFRHYRAIANGSVSADEPPPQASPIPTKLHRNTPFRNDQFFKEVDDVSPLHVVGWQMAPSPINPIFVNFDSMSANFSHVVDRLNVVKHEVINRIQYLVPLGTFDKKLSSNLTEPNANIFSEHNKNDEADDSQPTGDSQPTRPMNVNNNNTAAASSLSLQNVEENSPPYSFVLQPIFKELDGPLFDQTVVGFLRTLFPWQTFFENILPGGTEPLHLVLRNTCGQSVTFAISGPTVTVLSPDEDIHDTAYDGWAANGTLGGRPDEDAKEDPPLTGTSREVICMYDYSIYPTAEFYDYYHDSVPILSTVGVVFIFVLTSATFLLYDYLVARRQSKIEITAARSHAIVSSLFPTQVRERLMADSSQQQDESLARHRSFALTTIPFNNNTPNTVGGTGGLHPRSSSVPEDRTARLLRTKPIADLFPRVTVMFADIVGFTAWSSTREPSQVFTLLEQIYNSFDIIAKKRRVFKVETIGDCYVAAAGLPEPRQDHAVAMAHFAHECLLKMHLVVKKLEVRLGPDTAELCMRFGLHSGPVTAGVLRGEKSRFQLFGDTVNTASRIETTGEKNRIHLSDETAQLLIEAGKEGWIRKRDEVVTAKGKGEIVTYWLTLGETPFSGSTTGSSRESKDLSMSMSISMVGSVTRRMSNSNRSSVHRIPSANSALSITTAFSTSRSDERKKRLIAWNVDVLSKQLKKIVAMRGDTYDDNDDVKSTEESNGEGTDRMPLNENIIFEASAKRGEGTVLDEVREIIQLPQQQKSPAYDADSIELDPMVTSELHGYVSLIASMYRDNSFHNFEHASHVTQSVTKLLSRIATVDDIDFQDLQYKKKENDAELHKYTYGITSDPITQFACTFSALIHDVDHAGVPNVQLVKEDPDLARLYNGKSVAEQHSVDLAWDILMEPQFQSLRSTIYTTQAELERFRQLVVNAVMATDIVDKELGQLRKERWDKAFHPESESAIDISNGRESSMKTLMDDTNRRATIVIEHLIQASDVAHTMQHWHVYVKWNEKLFHEMYAAYLNGRTSSSASTSTSSLSTPTPPPPESSNDTNTNKDDPSVSWYRGELNFFDFYVIPLAKKLKECGVFGVSSDEYLNYALANRHEWELKGQRVIRAYMSVYNNNNHNHNTTTMMTKKRGGGGGGISDGGGSSHRLLPAAGASSSTTTTTAGTVSTTASSSPSSRQSSHKRSIVLT